MTNHGMLGRLRAARRAFFDRFFRAPVEVPFWGRHELVAIVGSLVAGRILDGSAIGQMEEAVAASVGTRYAIGTNFGRTSITLALRAFGVREGDEVVVPTFMCAAVGRAILHACCVPVFCDVGADWNISPESFEASITTRTKAVVAAHMYGHAARIEDVNVIAQRRGILVIEDAAHAWGASRGGRPLGSLGDVGVLSMYVGKALNVGGGGFLVTNDVNLAERARALALDRSSAYEIGRRISRLLWIHCLRRYTAPFVYGTQLVFGDPRGDVEIVAGLSNLEAAIGLVQLRRLPEIVRRRRRNAGILQGLLAGERRIELPPPAPDHIYTRFPVFLRGDLGAEGRDGRGALYLDFVRDLSRARVEVEWQYRPLHLRPEFSWAARRSLPAAEARWGGLLAVPVHPGLTEQDVRYVAAVVKRAAMRLPNGGELHPTR